MKHKFILTISFLQMVYLLQAQTSNSILVSNGLSRTFVYGDSFWKEFYEPSFLYNHALGISGKLNSTIHLRGELQHLIVGTEIEANLLDEFGMEAGESITQHNRMRFISLPLMVEYHPFKNDFIYAMLGGFVAYNYRSESYFDTGIQFLEDYTDFTDNVDRYDFGIRGGVGGGIKLLNDLTLNLEFIEAIGLNHISNLDGAATQKTISTSANLVLRFQLQSRTRN